MANLTEISVELDSSAPCVALSLGPVLDQLWHKICWFVAILYPTITLRIVLSSLVQAGKTICLNMESKTPRKRVKNLVGDNGIVGI